MTPKLKKIEVRRGSGSSWGRAWDEKSRNGGLDRFWPILAGHAQNGAKLAKVGAKLDPRWRQDGPKTVKNL